MSGLASTHAIVAPLASELVGERRLMTGVEAVGHHRGEEERRGRRLRTELLRSGAGTFALQAGAAALSVGSAVVMARILGVEQYGAYAFAMAVASLMVIPTTLGLPGLAVREVSRLAARERWGVLRGLLVWAARTVLVVSVPVAAGAALLVAGFDLGPDEAHIPLVLAMAVVPFVAVVQVGAAVLRGLGRVVLGHLHETVLRPGLALVVLVAAYAVAGDTVDADWAVGAQVVAAAAAVVLVVGLTARHVPRAVWGAVDEREPRVWLGAALPMMFIGAAQVVNVNTDVVMVGAFEGAEAAGLYRVASRGAHAVVFVLVAANTVLQPVVASMHARGEVERLQRVLTRSVRLVTLVALAVTVALVAAGGPVLRGVFGSEFGVAATALAILAGGQLVNASLGSAGTVLMMTGHERDAAVAVGVGAVVNVALNAVLVPLFGIEGAASATAVSVVTWNVILTRRSVRIVGLDPSVFGVFTRGRSTGAVRSA